MDEESDDTDNHSCEEDYYDEEDRQIPYFRQGTDSDDGLKFLYRGSVLEIIEVKKDYVDSTYPMFETTPFHFQKEPEETWVELFQIVDEETFRSWYDMDEEQERDTCVRFSENATVKEVDATKRFGQEKEVNLIKDQGSTGSDIDHHNEESSVTDEVHKEDNSDIEELSQFSDALDDEAQSDIEPDPDESNRSTDSEESNLIEEKLGVQEKEPKQSTRGSTITTEILKDASSAIINTDTDGGGPKQHE